MARGVHRFPRWLLLSQAANRLDSDSPFIGGFQKHLTPGLKILIAEVFRPLPRLSPLGYRLSAIGYRLSAPPPPATD